MIKLDIEIGDAIRVGRFKNKKVVVKNIGKDENGLPTINGKGILKIRIENLMKAKGNTMKKSELHQIVGALVVAGREDLAKTIAGNKNEKIDAISLGYKAIVSKMPELRKDKEFQKVWGLVVDWSLR